MNDPARAYLLGALEALDAQGLRPGDLPKIASVSGDPVVRRLACMEKTARLDARLLKRLLATTGAPGAGTAVGVGGVLYGSSDEDSIANELRTMAGMDTRSRLESALGLGAGTTGGGTLQELGNEVFSSADKSLTTRLWRALGMGDL